MSTAAEVIAALTEAVAIVRNAMKWEDAIDPYDSGEYDLALAEVYLDYAVSRIKKEAEETRRRCRLLDEPTEGEL